MSTSAQSVLLRAATTLQDPEGVRWPATELVDYINEGQRALVSKRPDLKAARVVFTPAQGALQDLPASAMLLMDVPSNATGRKRAMTKVDLGVLEATQRDWQSMPEAVEFSHFMYDLREPRKFFLYPPARATGAAVTLLVSLYPTNVTATGASFSTASGDLDLPDEFATAVLHYVLFRAYSKDAEFGGNAQLAMNHLQLFNAAIGEQLQSSAIVAPKS